MLAGLALIIFGNLMQGGFITPFLRSFYAEINQYNSDAIMVDNWRNWLAGFNENLPYLTLLLLKKEKDDYLWMILLAAIQTSIMQIFFGIYW